MTIDEPLGMGPADGHVSFHLLDLVIPGADSGGRRKQVLHRRRCVGTTSSIRLVFDMKQFGEQSPRFNFFLNPYQDHRFTRCPKCGSKTRLRKLPLVVHVDPNHLISINRTCRYCPGCELLIAHQDVFEHLLAEMFYKHAPEVIGNDYLVIGTIDRSVWKKGTMTHLTVRELITQLHDFKQVLSFEPLDYGWIKGDKQPGEA
ncbi:MAG: hypothetical protein KAS36_11180 [Anaerolineales bacterium]|nr:hypothetical protein [Anaerolineales bacterium]